MDSSSDIWQYVTIAVIVWLGLSLAQGAVRCFAPQVIDLDGQLLGIVLGIVGLVAYVIVLGIEVKNDALVIGAWLGLFAGAGIALLAGHEDLGGVLAIRGSGWFLIPWGASAASGLVGVLRQDETVIAASLVVNAGSLGAGLGQLLYSWFAVARFERELAVVPAAESPSAASIEPYSIETAALCLNGHAQAGEERFCASCGVPVRCPNGHILTPSARAFCTDCGAPVRGRVSATL